MKHRNRILLAVVVVAVLGGLAWVVLREPPEPVYEGKTLTHWLRPYQAAGILQDPVNIQIWQESDNAIRAIGTNAIPFLLQRLRATDSSLPRRLIQLAAKQRFIKIHYTSAGDLQCEATIAFGRLGTSASNAVPELIKIYNKNISPSSRDATLEAVAKIHAAPTITVPFLLMQTHNTNCNIAGLAVWGLGRIHTKPGIVVPALINILHGPDSDMRFCAANALAEFGSDAQSEVPLLVEYFYDETNSVRKSCLREDIKRIDPVAASKAGVK